MATKIAELQATKFHEKELTMEKREEKNRGEKKKGDGEKKKSSTGAGIPRGNGSHFPNQKLSGGGLVPRKTKKKNTRCEPAPRELPVAYFLVGWGNGGSAHFGGGGEKQKGRLSS